MKTGWSILAVWIGLTAVVARAWQENPPTGNADSGSVRYAEAVVELTLDDGIQLIVERALDAAMTDFRPDAAWAIVEKVGTGEILAMAARSSDGGGEAAAGMQSARMNIAAETVFEPGSIFAVGIVAAALNEGLVDANSLLDCENGEWAYEGKPLKDFHPYGTLDVTGVLRKSSGIGTAKIAALLGEERLSRYLADLGFGKPTGVEIADENPGCLRTSSEWGKPDIARMALGHGATVSALQLLNMLCCIGNDGTLMRPRLVKRVVGKDGYILMENGPEVVAQPITAATAKLMRNMLVEVIREGGTGTKAAVKGINVAGKTGTAEKIKDGHYVATEKVVSFMGILPAERPEIGIIVVLDNPQSEFTGSTSAAPVFATIAEAAAPCFPAVSALQSGMAGK